MAKKAPAPSRSLDSVMKELESLGSESCRKTYRNHGAPDPLFGVRVGDLKSVLKTIRNDTALARELWATGNGDAQYLAGLAVVPAELTKRDLEQWAKTASWYMLSEFSVPGVAAESLHGIELARKWIDAKAESVAACGWSTWGSLVAVQPDDALDMDELRALLLRCQKTIHAERNRVRYQMNNFVIGCASYVRALSAEAKRVAKAIGEVKVDMGKTACNVPFAPDYIEKTIAHGSLEKKRKSARC